METYEYLIKGVVVDYLERNKAIKTLESWKKLYDRTIEIGDAELTAEVKEEYDKAHEDARLFIMMDKAQGLYRVYKKISDEMIDEEQKRMVPIIFVKDATKNNINFSELKGKFLKK